MNTLRKFITTIESANNYSFTLILSLIGFSLYARDLFNGFIADDFSQIVNNSVIHSLSNIGQLFSGSTFNMGGTSTLVGIYYKPLLSVSFAILFSLWQANPFGYHLFDTVLHIFNTIIIFMLMQKLLGFQKFSYAKTGAFLLSFIFLIHPANVESVVYVSNTQELLYVFFLLISLLFTINYCTRKQSTKLLFAIVLCWLASLLSKESGILAPILSLTLVFFFWGKYSKRFIFVAIVVGVIYCFLRFIVGHIGFQSAVQISAIGSPIAETTFVQRLLTIPYEIASYVRLFFFPQSLALFQDDVLRTTADSRFWPSLVVAILTAISLFGVTHFIKSKLAVFFLIWILVGFGIVMNIVPLDITLSERFMYGPMIGLLGLGVLFVYKLFKITPIIGKILILLCVLFIPVFFVRSFIRIGDWKNETTLFAHDIIIETQSYRLYNMYGYNLLQQGKYLQSQTAFRKSIDLEPDQTSGYDGLGSSYYALGDYRKAFYYIGIAVGHGGSNIMYEHYALVLEKLDAPLLSRENFLTQALYNFPNDATLHILLSDIYTSEGKTEAAQREKSKANIINGINSSTNGYLQISN